MELCGTPNKIFSHELYSVLILVLCFRFSSQFCTSLKAAILNPYAFSFVIKRSCERQSWKVREILFCYRQLISISQALIAGYFVH